MGLLFYDYTVQRDLNQTYAMTSCVFSNTADGERHLNKGLKGKVFVDGDRSVFKVTQAAFNGANPGGRAAENAGDRVEMLRVNADT